MTWLGIPFPILRKRQRQAWAGGKNVPTQARHTLARHGITLDDAKRMADADLLALPNFGKKCLEWVRSQ